MKASLIATTLVGVLLSVSAFADGLRLGEPGYGGNGCPAGSASVTLSPDQKSLSILFDQYIVEAGSSSGKTLDRKACNIAIPVHVPQGFSVSVFAIDYRGYTAIPRGGLGRFSVEYFFAGSSGLRINENFRGGTDRDYLISHELEAAAIVWSACGADTNLRVNSSMLVRSNSYGDDALATVDSADIKSGLVYHLAWKRCR